MIPNGTIPSAAIARTIKVPGRTINNNGVTNWIVELIHVFIAIFHLDKKAHNRSFKIFNVFVTSYVILEYSLILLLDVRTNFTSDHMVHMNE